MKSLLLFLLITFCLYAENNTTKDSVDQVHGYFDEKVRHWATAIDSSLIDLMDYFQDPADENLSVEQNNELPLFEDTNTSETVDYTHFYRILERNQGLDAAHTSEDEHVQMVSATNLRQTPRSRENIVNDLVPQYARVDAFFLTRKLLESRDESYVRVSFGKTFNSLEDDPTNIAVRARLSLGRSKKRLKLFVEDFNQDSAENIGKSGSEESPSIGLDLFAKEHFGIKPRYSVGIRGIDPFVRARFSYNTEFGRWHFEPIQTFTYSLKDEFSETTEFFFDTPTSEKTLLRFVLSRGTQSYVNGMAYNGFVQWFYTPREHAGFSVNTGVNGSTKYQNTIIEGTPPVIEEENRVYNYLFVLRWRENIWKKWLFYEIAPGVNYHEMHDYHPNYNITFGIDLFFGHV